jgi:hypothetical protein
MRRKLWTAVLVTVVLMVLAGTLPDRLPSSGLIAAGSALWDDLVARLPALTRALETPAVAVGAAVMLAAMAGALFTLALVRRRRDPFGIVIREVRGGRHIACVARRTRLAQDAVRTLLHPGRTERRQSRRRQEEPSVPEGLTASGGRWRAPDADGMRWVESS